MKKINFDTEIKIQGGVRKPKIDILAYSGGVMEVAGWGAIVIDLSGLELPASMPILTDHEATTSSTIGTGKPYIEGGKLYISGVLNNSQKAKDIIEMAKSGQVWQASVGVDPKETEFIEAGESINVNGKTIEVDTGTTLIMTGRLREVSILPLGADDKTQVAIAAKSKRANFNIQIKDNIMTDLQKERQRVADIRAVIDRFNGLITPQNLRTIEAKAIDEGLDMSETSRLLTQAVSLEDVKAARPTMQGFTTPQKNEKPENILSAATLMMAGYHNIAEKAFSERELEAADRLKISCSANLCSAALSLTGADMPIGQSDMIKAAFSTNALSYALGDSSAKLLQETYKKVFQNWKPIAKKKNVKNFHEHKSIRPILKNGLLDIVGDSGELHHANLGEEYFTHQANTRGKMFAITRQTVVNDEIGVVMELLESLGLNTARTVHKLFWETLRDATVFTSDNGNYISGSTTALGIDSLTAAVLKLRSQTDGDGNPLGLEPVALAVPATLEASARQILSAIELNRTGDNSPTGNPWGGGNIQLLVEPYLSTGSNGSATAWYLFSDPGVAPAMIVSYLNGVENPVIETADAPFNTLGIQYRAYMDFGADTGDYRGAVKSKGKA